MKAIEWKRQYGEPITGTGTLVLKRLKMDGSLYSLQAYLPAGMDIAPHVFHVGTKAECRTHFNHAANWMEARFQSAG